MTTTRQGEQSRERQHNYRQLTAVSHDGSVDGIVTTRVPVSHCLLEHDFHDAVTRHRRPVRIVLVQVLVAMVTVGRRPGNRVVLGEIDGEHVTAQYSDTISWIEREAAVSDPERDGDRLADELVAVLVGSQRPPHLQVNDLRSSAAGRIHVPGDDVAVFGDSLRRVDDEDRALDAVLVFPPLSLASDIVRRLRVYTYMQTYLR